MIWRIVKWILFGILALVALPLVLLAIIFMAIPVRYKVDASTGRGDQNTVHVRATYLFGLARITHEYLNGEGATKVRIFGIPLRKKKQQQANSETPNKRKLAKESKKAKKAAKPKTPDKPKRTIIERLKGIKDNVSMVLTYPNRKTIIDLVKKMLKKQWKVLKPKKFNISGEVGFTDPSQTGFLFAAYGVVAEFLNIRKHIQLIGNFDTPNTVVMLDIYVRGSVSAIRVVLPILNLVRKKPMRKLIKDIINFREDN